MIWHPDDPHAAGAAYLDDSYRSDDTTAPVVVARIPSGLDIRWHRDVVEKLASRSRELKASRVLNHWEHLPSELRRAIQTTIREARVSILDPRAYALEFDSLLSTMAGLGRDGRDAVRRKFLAGYVREAVIWDSPAWRIQRMLFPEPALDLAEIYGVSSQRSDDDSLFKELRKKLQKPRAVALYGARSAAAFGELLDPELRRKAIEQSVGTWRIDWNPDVDIYLAHRQISQVFDEGERTSVGAIEFLRDRADVAAQRHERFPLILPPAGATREEPSVASPELQAADLAAGYARRLYESSEGLRKVCLEFRQVLLNGELIRDWKENRF